MKITEGNLKAILQSFKLLDLDISVIFNNIVDNKNQKLIDIDIHLLTEIMNEVSVILEERKYNDKIRNI